MATELKIKSRDKVREAVASCSGYYNEYAQFFTKVAATLDYHGINCECWDYVIYSDEGRAVITIDGVESCLVVYWYRMPVTFRWEITCYLS